MPPLPQFQWKMFKQSKPRGANSRDFSSPCAAPLASGERDGGSFWRRYCAAQRGSVRVRFSPRCDREGGTFWRRYCTASSVFFISGSLPLRFCLLVTRRTSMNLYLE